MIDQDHTTSVLTLHEKGMRVRAIARTLKISRNAVRRIIARGGVPERRPAANAVPLDEELLRSLYTDCQGYVERMWEKLREEQGFDVGYSTVTRRVRELGLGRTVVRSDRVADIPGAEMQHDTSPHVVPIAGKRTKVTTATLYFRFSKQIYAKFYPAFDRFRMKCFLHEALTHYGYSAPTCIIDNTNLAVLRGTGKRAVMVAEMDVFAKRYAFQFIAHELGHADRKAGEERGFWTIETNFFPGRNFSSLEDMNLQAKTWATETMALRERKKTRLIPAVAWERETAHLTKIGAGLPPPYRHHERRVDQYGYISFGANSYWVPTGLEGTVSVLEYASSIKVLKGRHEYVSYELPQFGTRGEIYPAQRPHIPYQPRHRTEPAASEEAALRLLSVEVVAYLDFVLAAKGVSRHKTIRAIHALYRRTSLSLFCRVIERAHAYRVTEVASLERMAVLLVRDGSEHVITPNYDEEYENRAAYQEGRYIDHPDLSRFDY